MSCPQATWFQLALLCVSACRAFVVTGIAVMTFVSTAAAQGSGCMPAERRDALRAIQAQVLAVAPRRLDSLEKAIQRQGHCSATGSCLTGTSCLHTQEPGFPLRDEVNYRLVNGRRQPVSGSKQ